MSEKDDPLSKIFNTDESLYGPRFKEHVLHQYKLFVDSTNKISDRRATANNFFLSLNGFLVSVIGILPQLNSSLSFSAIWLIVVSIGGIIFCSVWAALITSYRKLNESKFAVIFKIEERLPMSLFKPEWEYLKMIKAVPKVDENQSKSKWLKKYSPLTYVEIKIPIVFIFLYIGIICASIYLSKSENISGFLVKLFCPF